MGLFNTSYTDVARGACWGGGMPFCQMIDGGTHGDQHSECLSRPLLCFHFFVFVSRVRPSNLSL